MVNVLQSTWQGGNILIYRSAITCDRESAHTCTSTFARGGVGKLCIFYGRKKESEYGAESARGIESQNINQRTCILYEDGGGSMARREASVRQGDEL